MALIGAGTCGDDDDDDDEATAASASASPAVDLEGTAWALTAEAPLGVSLENVSVTARFEDGTLAGQSGCNQYTTSYEVDGPSLTVGADIAGTRMACPAETAVEEAYLERLPQVASYTIAGNILTLADDDGESILEYEATAGEGIVGSWTVTSYYAGDAVTSVLGGVELTAEFATGEVSGTTGCNTFNGPYETDGETIEIGPLAATRAACPTEELQQQEDDYLAALQLATTFTVSGGRLDLFRPGGAYTATLDGK